MILAIDPGPLACGIVLYDEDAGRVLTACAAVETEDVLDGIRWTADGVVVAIEQVQSYGQAGGSLLRTAEVSGRCWQCAREHGLEVVLMPRRDVLRWLGLAGARGTRDAAVRERMIDTHGGSREAAVGRKATPGPLYGVSSHAWQALGLAVAVAESRRER